MSPRKPHPPARIRSGANPSGVHFLGSARVVDDLVRSCSPGPDDLVVELGAGHGAITSALARTGAAVLAVERDPEFARRLSRRTGGYGNVAVRQHDARTFPLPHKPFLVVASIPYSISTILLRRLLGTPSTALRRAALVVEWGFAVRLCAPVPRTRELAWWAARFDTRLIARVPARHFRPAPRVDSAHVRIERHTRMGPRTQAALWTVLGAAYDAPRKPARSVAGLAGGNPYQLLTGAGIDPETASSHVRPRQWAALASILAEDRALRFPPLPRSLSDRAGRAVRAKRRPSR